MIARQRAFDYERGGTIAVVAQAVVVELEARCELHEGWRYTLPVGGLVTEQAAADSIRREVERHLASEHTQVAAAAWHGITGSPLPESRTMRAQRRAREAQQRLEQSLPQLERAINTLQLSRRRAYDRALHMTREALALLRQGGNA